MKHNEKNDDNKSIIWHALRLARDLKIISNAVYVTAEKMVALIKNNNQQPICCAQVQYIASVTNRSPSTIFRHIQSLCDAGLATNETRNNGHRGSFFDGNIQLGINFKASFSKCNELENKIQNQCEIKNLNFKLRIQISKTRKQIKQILKNVTTEARAILERIDVLPVRYHKFSNDELSNIYQECVDIKNALQAEANQKQPSFFEEDRAKMEDAPIKKSKHYTNNENNLDNVQKNKINNSIMYLKNINNYIPIEWKNFAEDLELNLRQITTNELLYIAQHFYYEEMDGNTQNWKYLTMANDVVILIAILMLAYKNRSKIKHFGKWINAMTAKFKANEINWNGLKY